jgi:hypothetical protein
VVRDREMKIPVQLDDRELLAVTTLAERELRSLPDQVRMIVRERLYRDGLLEGKQEPAAVR